jgi:uroporphyrinogen decarboxylase
MTGRERIRKIIAGEPTDRCGLWLGEPTPETWSIYSRYFGVSSQEQWRSNLGDDYRWVPGWGAFPCEAHAPWGLLGECSAVSDLERYSWPSADTIDFKPALATLAACGDSYRASGMWTCFFQNAIGLMGMEGLMISMMDNPPVVHAVIDRICQYYYDANERFYSLAGDAIDGFFFANDLGTQLDLLCGPAQIDEFVLPWIRTFCEQARRHGRQVIMHSCGSIWRIIDRLIDAGVQCLHPLQARARNMDADFLAERFKGRIAFLGGIDTQDLLVNATPRQVCDEVRRVRRLLGPRLIVSPSHESLLPNVPPENVAAMARTALET